MLSLSLTDGRKDRGKACLYSVLNLDQTPCPSRLTALRHELKGEGGSLLPQEIAMMGRCG